MSDTDMTSQTPLIEGNRVTFLWRGGTPPGLNGDFNYWGLDRSPIDLEPRDPGVWARTIEFPADAYIEYLFDRDGIAFADPGNPRRVDNGVGDANSFFTMPEWRESALIHERPGVAHGEVIEDVLDWEGHFSTPSRQIFFYRPPVPGPVPLLVVLDGPDYLRRGRLAAIVDNLIAEERIAPIAMALIENGGLGRGVEYACSEATIACIVKQVVPLAREHLDLSPSSDGGWGMMGASLGGLMSLYTGVRVPETFGRVLAQSGAFDSRHLARPGVITDLIRLQNRLPLRIWMDAARHEWYLNMNYRMRDLLQARGYDFAFEEHSGGHNYTSWRNAVHRGLEYLFPVAG